MVTVLLSLNRVTGWLHACAWPCVKPQEGMVSGLVPRAGSLVGKKGTTKWSSWFVAYKPHCPLGHDKPLRHQLITKVATEAERRRAFSGVFRATFCSTANRSGSAEKLTSSGEVTH